MKLLNITCKEATFLIVKKEDAAIALGQKIKLALHLLICNFCRLFQKQNHLITDALRKMEAEASLSPAEKKKIKNTLLNSENNTSLL